MEMQQTELFATRPVKAIVGPHLRLVQKLEKLEVFQGAPTAVTRHESPAPAAVPGVSLSPQKAPRTSPPAGLRAIAPEHVERFLNQLHGEALLIGALSYDLGLRLSQLRFLRVRDVNLTARVIELSDGAKQIPVAVFDDLKDLMSEKMSGSELGHGVHKRDQLIFSHEGFEHVLLTCTSFFAGERREVENDDSASDLTVSALHSNQGTELGQRVRDNFLRVMGWFHTKRAARRGGRVESPLGLFDKGPKIVRRDRGGAVHSYYLWRAVYSR
jgi:hypothetical protein